MCVHHSFLCRPTPINPTANHDITALGVLLYQALLGTPQCFHAAAVGADGAGWAAAASQRMHTIVQLLAGHQGHVSPQVLGLAAQLTLLETPGPNKEEMACLRHQQLAATMEGQAVLAGLTIVAQCLFTGQPGHASITAHQAAVWMEHFAASCPPHHPLIWYQGGNLWPALPASAMMGVGFLPSMRLWEATTSCALSSLATAGSVPTLSPSYQQGNASVGAQCNARPLAMSLSAPAALHGTVAASTHTRM